MENRRLVIIDHEPYRDFKRKHYYIDEFEHAGFKVEFWSVWKVFDYSKNLAYKQVDSGENVYYIEHMQELLHMLDEISSSGRLLVCVECYFSWSNIQLYKELFKTKYTVFSINHYHSLTQVYRDSNTFLEKVKYFFLRTDLLKRIKNRFFNALYKQSPIQYIFATGSLAYPSRRRLYSDSITYFDVKTYEENTYTPRLVEERYIVFLDTFLPYHPDSIRSGYKKGISADIYYQKHNRFFDQLENTFNCKVVIAAHPKSNYTDEFGDRICIRGETCRLVRDSLFVLDSLSLSINFALFYNKKIYSIYSNEFLDKSNLLLSDIYRAMQYRDILLDATMINIDDAWNTILWHFQNQSFSDQKYREYENKYLYSTHYPKPNFEIIYQRIRSDFNEFT